MKLIILLTLTLSLLLLLQTTYQCQCPEESNDTRIAYTITVHNNRTITDALHLFRTIRSPTSLIILHIDTKYNASSFPQTSLYREIQECHCGSIVHYDSIYSSTWGEWSMNEPTHWSMNVLIHHPKFRHKWDVYINLSGDTLPVYKHHVIQKWLGSSLKGINFVTSSGCETGLLPTNVYDFPSYWHKRQHYTEEETLSMPNVTYYVDYKTPNKPLHKKQSKVITTYFGSQWMILTYQFVEYLVLSLDDPLSLPYKYKEYLIQKQRLMTDETYIPSLIQSEFPETLPKIHTAPPFQSHTHRLSSPPYSYAIRYERMDEHVPKILSGWYPSHQHYNPTDHIWGPYYLGVYDLKDIKDSGALFVRKISVSVDENMYRILPVDRREDIPEIGWVNHQVDLSDVPDWEREKERLMEKARRREEAKLVEEEEVRGDGDDGDGDGEM